MRLINADDLVKIFHREGNSDAWGGEFIRRTIEEQPTIEAEPIKHGRWIEDEYGIPHCSECKAINNTVYRNYCPNCGAKMDE